MKIKLLTKLHPNKKLYLVFLVISCLSSGCNDKQGTGQYNNEIDNSEVISIDSTLKWEKINDLGKDLKTSGKITSFDFVNKDRLIISVSDPAGVFIYHINGRLISQVSKKGKGPNEYISPSVVRSENQKIYIWCSELLKLLVFDTSGDPIEEYNFSKAIRDFVIIKNYAGLYSSGGGDEPILRIYDLSNNEFIKSYGNKTNEHKILNAFNNTGGLTKYKNRLFFAPSDRLSIFGVNLKDFSIGQYNIDDTEFRVKTVDIDARKFVPNPRKTIRYYLESDFINGLFYIDNRLVLKAQVGKIEIKNFKFQSRAKGKIELDLQDPTLKKQKYYVFNKNMKIEYTFKANIKNIKKHNDCHYTGEGKYLYKIKLSDDNQSYELSRTKL